jgi:hypothetical protein
MSTLVLALVLALVAVALIALIASLLWGAVRAPLQGAFERQRIDRYVARVQAADRALAAGDLDGVLAVLPDAFCPYLARSQDVANAIANHHTGLLARLIAAADARHDGRVRLLSLAKVDRLLQERVALQRRYLSARQSGRGGRPLTREWRANTQAVRAALASFAAEVAARSPAARVH